MKKILLATTMLAGTAGFAAAEVTLSGYAEMGIVGGYNWGGCTTQFYQDIDVTFSMSGETDGGLTFGTSIDLDEAGNSFGDNDGGTSVYISGAFGKLTLGDTDGGFDWALSETGMGTAITDDHTTHTGYSGNGGLDGWYDGQILRYEYSAGDFAAAASVEMDDFNGSGIDDPVIGLGMKYTMSGVTLGVGYQSNDDANEEIIGASVSGETGGIKYVVNYSDRSGSAPWDNRSHMGLGLGYTSGALMVSANYGVFDYDGGGQWDGYGLVANYDLGGGAVVMAGYASDVGIGYQWSLGLGMSF
jgi:outer membrane protein OmpU